MTRERAEDDVNAEEKEPESGLLATVEGDEGVVASKKARKGKVEVGNAKPKKPLSKWILFSCEQRELMMKEHPQLGLMEINKLISEKYKQISAADSERLDTLALHDKERYQRELSEWQEPPPTAADGERTPTAELTFPLVRLRYSEIHRGNRPNMNDLLVYLLLHTFSLSQSRVRKTIKLDPDVRKVSTECAVVITKATELFAMHLATQSARTASLRGSRAVRDVDVLHTIHSSDAL
eukprot:gene30643-40736_t